MVKKDIHTITQPNEADLKGRSKKKRSSSSSGSIHVMPDYFRNAHLRKKNDGSQGVGNTLTKPGPSPKSSKSLLIVLLSVILLVIIGVGGYLIFTNYQRNQLLQQEREAAIELEKQRQEALEAQRLAAEQAQQQQQVQDEQERERQQRLERDQERIQDINTIQRALEFYFDDESEYPPFLPEQGTFSLNNNVYLDTVPQNPSPGGQQYTYTVSETNRGYTLTFVLEEGFGDLPAGEQTASEQRQITTQGTIITRSPRSSERSNNLGFLISADADLDGVTDIEEDFYGTNKMEFDSDNDTYSDKQELINLYNPAGLAPIRLIESGIVNDYNDSVYNYSVYYPTTWLVKPLDATNTEVLFTSDTGEFIEVMVQDNAAGLNAEEWLSQQNLISQIDLNQRVTTREGLVGIRSRDRRTVYYFEGDKVYIIIHNVGNKEEIDYDVTFEMMLRSFRVGQGEVEIEAESGDDAEAEADSPVLDSEENEDLTAESIDVNDENSSSANNDMQASSVTIEPNDERESVNTNSTQ